MNKERRKNWDDGNADEKVQGFKGSKVQRFFVLKYTRRTGMIGTRMTRMNWDDRNTDDTDEGRRFFRYAKENG